MCIQMYIQLASIQCRLLDAAPYTYHICIYVCTTYTQHLRTYVYTHVYDNVCTPNEHATQFARRCTIHRPNIYILFNLCTPCTYHICTYVYTHIY